MTTKAYIIVIILILKL